MEATALFDELSSAPFPELGKQLGDFGLYDSLVAGALSAATKNQERSVPSPDNVSQRFAEELRHREDKSASEREFLQYWFLLERICRFLENEKADI